MTKIYFQKSIIGLMILMFCGVLNVNAQTPEYHYGLTTAGNVFPLSSTSNNRVQWLYPIAEFNTPAPAAGFITKVYLKRSGGSTNPSVFQNLTIRLGEIPTTMTQFPNATFWIAGMIEVLPPTAVTIPGSADGSWIEFDLAVPFAYDGVSNLVLEMSQTSYTNGITLHNVQTGTTNRRIWGAVGSTAGTVGTGPVDFGFDMTAVNLNVLDIGVDEIVLTEVFCFGESQDATLTIKNFGVFQVDTFNVGWSINGLPQTPFGFNQLIDTAGGTFDETVDITLTGLDFPDGDSEVKFWTFLPNNDDDENNFNDTITIDLLAKSYLTPITEILCEGDTLIVADTFFTATLEDYELLLSSVDGCDSTILINLTINPPISYPWDGTKVQLCDGDIYTINAQHPNANSYMWDDLSVAPSKTVNSAGVYTVQATDEDGVCSVTASIELDYKPLPQITFPTAAIYCHGDSVVLNAGPDGVSYLWSNGATTSSIKVGETGLYEVVVESEFGCESTESIQLDFYPLPSFENWVADEIGTYKFQFILENPNSVIAYHWDFGDGTTSTLPQPIHQYEGPGVYTVFLTLESMCGEANFYKIMEMAVDIDELETGDKYLKIYPNPAKDLLEVSLENNHDAIQYYKIMDAQGRVVLETKDIHQSAVRINIESLSSGTYFIEVVTKEESIKRTFIKTK